MRNTEVKRNRTASTDRMSSTTDVPETTANGLPEPPTLAKGLPKQMTRIYWDGDWEPGTAWGAGDGVTRRDR